MVLGMAKELMYLLKIINQTWAEGGYYVGEWRNDMADGKGKLVHMDGDVYEGDWKSDMANG